MNAEIGKSPSSLMWISTIAIVMFSGVGIAAIMDWLPASSGDTDKMPQRELVAEAVTVKSGNVKPVHKHHAQVVSINENTVVCVSCGVIESVRVINDVNNACGNGLVSGAPVSDTAEKSYESKKCYEVTARFDDGSIRVFNESDPPVWQSGDHVRVIDGMIRSNG